MTTRMPVLASVRARMFRVDDVFLQSHSVLRLRLLGARSCCPRRALIWTNFDGVYRAWGPPAAPTFWPVGFGAWKGHGKGMERA